MSMSMRFLAGIAIAVAPAFAQAPVPALAFEVASIKPAAMPTPAQMQAGKLHVGMNIDAARVDIGFLSLAELIPIAFRVKPYQVSGPSWMSAQRFDVLAKMPEGATKEQVPDMLQALLAERFKLTFHRESKEHSVYALVVGKNGPKLKESPPEETAPPAEPGAEGAPKQQINFSRSGEGVVVKGGETGTTKMSMGPNGTMHMEASKVTLATFADMLSRFMDRPVLDMTELKGNYQVALDLTMDDLRAMASKAGVAIPAQASSGEAGRQPADAATDPSGSSIFMAVQQLGLKLEPRKAPVELIVIDHLEKAPTEN